MRLSEMMKTPLALLALLCAAAFARQGDAEAEAELRALAEEKAALEREIASLDRDLAATDSARAAEGERAAAIEARTSDDLARRAAEIDTLETRIRGLARDLKAERAAQNAVSRSEDQVQAKRDAVSALILKSCREFEAQEARTAPQNLAQRRERLAALCRDVETGNAPVEEAFSRLTALFGEEIRFGDEAALRDEPVRRSDGELVNAHVLRAGNVWMAYADEQFRRFGLLKGVSEDGSPVWDEDLDLETRAMLRLAVEVKLGRKPPQIVVLPFAAEGPKAEGTK